LPFGKTPRVTAVILACLSGFCLGALSVGTRFAVRRAPSILAGSFVMNTGAFAVVSIVALAAGVSASDIDIEGLWPFLALGAIVPGVTQMLYVQAVRDTGAARTQVLMSVSPLIAALLAVALLDEEWSPLLIVGTLLIVAGSMALAWDPARPVGYRRIGMVLAGGMAVIMAGRDTATRWALTETDSSVLVEAAATLLAATVMTALLGVVLADRPPDLGALRAAVLPFGAVALLMGAAYATLFGALERRGVTLVAPLVGTHALWSVAIAALLLRRNEAIGRRLIGAALLVVAGAALVSAVRGEDGRVTVAEATAELAEADAGVDSGAGPARGVYVYRTEGSEDIDALLSPSHTYPDETVLSVRGTAGGWTERWAPLEGRSTERDLCSSGRGLQLLRYLEIHTFVFNEDVRSYECDTDALLLSAASEPGVDSSFTCDAGHTRETWIGGLVSRGPDPLADGETVIHLRFDTVLSGRTAGTSVKELWLRERDLLLMRERVVNESATGTAIGDVHYAESYTLELHDPTPAG
jgi:drug/metabolite transporter (DMT)-like permease